MPVFREIPQTADPRRRRGASRDLYQPARMPSMEELLYAHDENYVDAFRHGALDETSMRKIGLPWSERSSSGRWRRWRARSSPPDLALATGTP